VTVTISGRKFDLHRDEVERMLRDVLPDPLRAHYIVVGGRRFPPKQVLAEATGLDRADFTTHQARRILQRLGFPAGRIGPPHAEPAERTDRRLPHGGRQAEALRPYRGQWVALGEPTEVLVAAPSLDEVHRWLVRHGRKAYGGVFRVPVDPYKSGGMAPL
jgi:hypothetical protein